ncbi:MAG: hypothetical protein ABIQ04_03685 [Candidatus Saccharimonadales bacterium]
MPFIEVSFDERMFEEEKFIEQYQIPRIALIDEIIFAVAENLSFAMEDGTRNHVVPEDFSVRVYEIDSDAGERQAKDVEIKIEAIGFPDRMANRQGKSHSIREYLEGNFPGITFGVWLDLKPDAVWSSD